MAYERRVFLALIGAGTGGYVWWSRGGPKAMSLPSRVRIAEFDNSGRETGVMEVDAIRKADAEWAKLLPADSFSVTRRGDTEFAGTGRYDKFYEDGIYRCVCCGTALFSSKAKYASGTGWPSFTEPMARENVREAASAFFGIRETEVKCTRCDAHLGHVFDDGPPPGGLRYCINSGALRFVGHNLT
jgi:peptide-methionine (R)-S-oxide reductase